MKNENHGIDIFKKKRFENVCDLPIQVVTVGPVSVLTMVKMVQIVDERECRIAETVKYTYLLLWPLSKSENEIETILDYYDT